MMESWKSGRLAVDKLLEKAVDSIYRPMSLVDGPAKDKRSSLTFPGKTHKANLCKEIEMDSEASGMVPLTEGEADAVDEARGC